MLSVGAAATPAEVSMAGRFSSSQRLRLMSDHLLVGFRGVNLRAYRSSSRRLIRLSIHRSTALREPNPRKRWTRCACELCRTRARLPGLWNGALSTIHAIAGDSKLQRNEFGRHPTLVNTFYIRLVRLLRPRSLATLRLTEGAYERWQTRKACDVRVSKRGDPVNAVWQKLILRGNIKI